MGFLLINLKEGRRQHETAHHFSSRQVAYPIRLRVEDHQNAGEEKHSERRLMLNGNEGCSIQRQTAGGQVLRLLDEIKIQAMDLNKKIAENLSSVTRQEPPEDADVLKEPAEGWPPLFSEYRQCLIVIRRNLSDINRTIERLEI